MAVTSLPDATSANLQATTAGIFNKSVAKQVFMKMPLLARLLMANQIKKKGGRYIAQPVDKAEMDDLGQFYSLNEKMTSGRKTMLDNPYFLWKNCQVPVAYDLDEYLQNKGEGQIVDYAAFLAKKAHRAARIKLYKAMYAITGTSTDSGKYFQSVIQALQHDATYGHLSRADTTTNSFWQGASVDGTFTDQATSRSPSLDTFRKAVNAIGEYSDSDQNLMCVVGPAIHMELKSQLEARKSYVNNSGPMFKYGFDSFMIDNVEVVKDYWLANKHLTDSHKYMFIYNIPEWELRLEPTRAFKMTPFVWQGDKADGYDEWLARILLRGNLWTRQPNASIWLSNVA